MRTHDRNYSRALGKRVQSVRKTKKIRQAEMAEKLGVSRSLYSAYETGARRMNAEVFLRISQLLDVPVDVIVESEKSLDDMSVADAETAAKAFEMYLADIQSEYEVSVDIPTIQWAALGIDIANNLNETGQQLIKDYIDVIRANPLMCKD